MNIARFLNDDAEDLDDPIAVDDDVSIDPVPMAELLSTFTNVVSGSNEYNVNTTNCQLNVITKPISNNEYINHQYTITSALNEPYGTVLTDEISARLKMPIRQSLPEISSVAPSLMLAQSINDNYNSRFKLNVIRDTELNANVIYNSMQRYDQYRKIKISQQVIPLHICSISAEN